MKNTMYTQWKAAFRLSTLLFLISTAFQASAQIVIDDCNTAAFDLFGNNSINDMAASGAIGGKRDVQISNANVSARIRRTAISFFADIIQVTPRPNYPDYFSGNYDIGWGDNDFLGGTELNLNAANYDRVVVTFKSTPYHYGQISIRFNKPGDPDYCSASVPSTGALNYTFPFSSFAGLDPYDIDGISLGFENCIPDTVFWIDHIQITGTADNDGDGILNGNDNCPDTANADQADADGDGIGDACDACPNDADNDADGDGVCGDLDNCDTANPDQSDVDNDGIGDACDACPNDANNDADGDGVCGDVDNCDSANPDQSDVDGDGIGDACDACPNDADNDADGDGVCGDLDNCDSANPDQSDVDGDGIGDVCDDCPYAAPGIAHFDAGTCHCEPGYYEVTTLNGEVNIVTGCQLCPPGRYCPDGISAYLCEAGTYADNSGQTSCNPCPAGYYMNVQGAVACIACPAGTYSDFQGAVECLSCPQGTHSEQGATECTPNDGDTDSDCDGIPDVNDHCPGGDDNGPCDANSFPGFNNIPNNWRCGNNNNKVKMCHEGATICVSPNAVQAHLNHGDFLGPCVSCGQNKPATFGKTDNDIAQGMELTPNPAGDVVTLQLNHLDGKSEINLEIFNAFGQLMLRQSFGTVSYLEEQIDLGALSDGMYFVNVQAGDVQFEQKLVVRKK